mgnify:CR=1 FL=1
MAQIGDVVSVACGEAHTAALTSMCCTLTALISLCIASLAHSRGLCQCAESGEVYTWGYGGSWTTLFLGAYGALGHKKPKSTEPEPLKVEALNGVKIKQIAAGRYHMMALAGMRSGALQLESVLICIVGSVYRGR